MGPAQPLVEGGQVDVEQLGERHVAGLAGWRMPVWMACCTRGPLSRPGLRAARWSRPPGVDRHPRPGPPPGLAVLRSGPGIEPGFVVPSGQAVQAGPGRRRPLRCPSVLRPGRTRVAGRGPLPPQPARASRTRRPRAAMSPLGKRAHRSAVCSLRRSTYPASRSGSACRWPSTANGNCPLVATTGHHAMWSAAGTMITLDCRSERCSYGLSSMKERLVSRGPDGFSSGPLRPGGALGVFRSAPKRPQVVRGADGKGGQGRP